MLYGTALVAADRHMGVATCASGACHGSARPLTGSTVRQDEYFTWQRKDRHARAFETLRGDKSRRIAANLGLPNAAEARECLLCHADAVPAAERAEGHQLGDGVGCEVCHGAGERWLGPHSAGFKTAAERRRAGMFPVWETVERAGLCLSCHQGDAGKPMTHRILGAGHPPLGFELDTFASVMPAHHAVDADYLQRKGPQDGARNWLVGQLAASALLLENLATVHPPGGLFPELASFNCNACHHSLDALRWQPGIAAPLKPGSVRLADTSLKMVGHWLEVFEPAQSKRWREATAQLHAATQESATAVQARARAMQDLLKNEVMPRAVDDALEPARLMDLLKRILREHRDGPAGSDFSDAEQATMATAVLFTALTERGGARLTPEFRAALDGLYAAVQDRDRFLPADFRKALGRADSALAKAR